MFGVYKLKRKLLPFLLLFALIVAIVPTSAVLASESGSAQIGDISYASLQEAFNAVPEDGVQTTVTLTNRDVRYCYSGSRKKYNPEYEWSKYYF